MAVLLYTMFLSLPLRYESNDDFAMISELNGFLPGTDCFFLNPLTSKCLHALYKIFPNIPWYGLWIYLAAYLGFSMTTSVFFRRNRGLPLLLCGPCLFIIFFHCFAFASFTSSSLLLLFGVFLCLLDWAVTDKCPFECKYLYITFLTICLFISFSLRWQLVLYLSILSVPVFLFARGTFYKRFWPFAAGLIAVLILSAYFTFHANDEKHFSFAEYNRLRSRFHDSDKGEYYKGTTLKAIQKAGWDWNDFILFRNYWFLHDQKRFNTQTLSVFLQENDPLEKRTMIRQIASRAYIHLKGNQSISLILFITIIAIFMFQPKSLLSKPNLNIAKILISLCIISAIALFLMYHRFVPRVYLPLYAYILGATFLMLYQSSSAKNVNLSRIKYWSQNIFTMIIILSLCWLTWIKSKALIEYLRAKNMEKKIIMTCLLQVKNLHTHPDDLLLIPLNPNNNLLQETVHPLKEFSDFPAINILPGGWQINSPRYFRFLKHYGMQDGNELLHWTVNNKKALWFQYIEDQRDAYLANLIETYFKKHITPGKETKLEIANDFRNEKGLGLVFFAASNLSNNQAAAEFSE